VEAIDYLNDQQNQSLNKKFPNLFSGGLGTLDIEPVHLELKPGATPFPSRAYSIPKV